MIRLFSWAWRLSLVVGLLAACGGQSSERDLMAAANESLAKNDLPAATIHLKNALDKYPSSAQVRLLFGSVLLKRGDAVGAEAQLRKALELQASKDAVLPLLAQAVSQQGRHTKVIQEFDAATLTTPEALASVKSMVALAHLRLGQVEPAAKAVEQSLQAVPGQPTARLVRARLLALGGDTDGALKLVDEVIAQNPSMPEALASRGDLQAFGARNVDKALEAYRAAAAARADYLPAQFQIMSLLLFRRDIEGARAQQKVLKSVAPTHFQTRFFEAQVQFLDQDFERARTTAQDLLKAAPENVRVLSFDGMLRLQLDAPLLAEMSLAKAVNLAPDDRYARALLAKAHLRMGQAEKALADLAPVLESGQADHEVLALAGDAYILAGRADRAEEFYRRAVQANPADSGARTVLAVARLARGETEAAFDELRAIAAKDTTNTADLAIVAARIRRGEWDLALKAVTELEAKTPGKPLAPQLAGRIHMAKKDPVAARKSFERAVQIDPLFFAAVADLVRMDMSERKPADARKRLEQLLAKDPKNLSVQLALIDVRIAEGAPRADILRALNDAIRIDATTPTARLALVNFYLGGREAKEALVAAQEAASTFPNRVDVLESLGRAQIASHELNQALSTFGRLSILQPKSTAPLIRQSEIYSLMGNLPSSESALRRALDLAPNDPQIHRRMVAVAMAAKQQGKAVERARALQKLRPEVATGYLLEAEIEGGRKNWPATLAALRAGLDRVKPADSRVAAKYYIATQLSAGKPAAEAFAADWVKKNPGDPLFVTQLGEYWLGVEDYAAAERYLLEADRLMPRNASVLNNLAWVTLKLRKPGALAYARAASELAPDTPPVLDTLLLALADAGKNDEAIELAKRLLASSPNPFFRLHLARLYVRTGKMDLAKPEIEQLERIGDKFGGYMEVRELRASLK